MTGELTKMKIKAVNPDDGNVIKENGSDLIYEVLVNPETYTINHRVQYSCEDSPAGSSGRQQRFVRILPSNLEFDFLFDSTGVIPKPLTGIAELSSIPIVGAIVGAVNNIRYNILEEIEKFKKLVYELDGPSHSPRTVQLIWGTLFFEGVITSLNFNFKLFHPDGIPIRAVAHASFDGNIEDKLQAALDRKSSPDLTHIRQVKQGDTLPLMTYEIYGDSIYYLEVARINNLINFRNLNPGDKIKFPPLNNGKK